MHCECMYLDPHGTVAYHVWEFDINQFAGVEGVAHTRLSIPSYTCIIFTSCASTHWSITDSLIRSLVLEEQDYALVVRAVQ